MFKQRDRVLPACSEKIAEFRDIDGLILAQIIRYPRDQVSVDI
jgi:hypothetical protein